MKKTVFVTGAGRGIGRAIANFYREKGCDVIAPSRNEMDLASLESIKNYLQKNERLSPDILINNAGENRIFPLSDIPGEVWERTLSVNLTAAFHLVQHFSKSMKIKKWGRIVNISSVYSLVAREGRAVYSVTKAGMNALTRTAAVELGTSNVLVNSLCPGFVDTDLTRQNNSPEQIRAIEKTIPLGRLATPEEIARFVYFLGSEENTYLTGQTIAVDGGFLINRNLN